VFPEISQRERKVGGILTMERQQKLFTYRGIWTLRFVYNLMHMKYDTGKGYLYLAIPLHVT
jgi:hypothetical protein